MQLSAGVSRSVLSCLMSNELIRTQQVPEWQFELQCFQIQGSFAPVRVLFSPFDGSKILLPFAQKTFGFHKLIKGVVFSFRVKIKRTDIWTLRFKHRPKIVFGKI